MKLLVVGATGQLGSAVVESCADLEVVGCSHTDLDVTDHRSVARVLADQRPDVVVNCSAFNDVDAAEHAAACALAVNTFGVGALARHAAAVGARLVHYSTDFVFDGRGDHTYTEDDAPSPQSVYAASKLMGEWLAQEASRSLVFRVESLFGGPRPRSSVDRIVEGLDAGREVHAFVDRTISPSYVHDVAAATRAALEAEIPPGLYHCVNAGRTTWYALAVEAARLLGSSSTIVPTPVEAIAGRAPRPTCSPLSAAKLARLGITLPPWQDALRRYIAVRRAGGAQADSA